jgi:hypothetical protein
LLESNGEFNKILSNVWDMLEARQSKDKLERLKVSRTLEERVTSLDFRNELSQQRSHIVELEAIRKGKEAAVKESEETLRDLISSKQAITKIIAERERYLRDL